LKPLRIATWNLDKLSINSPRAKDCFKIMGEVNADIWVLTEAH
jgi:hypothetical protein